MVALRDAQGVGEGEDVVWVFRFVAGVPIARVAEGIGIVVPGGLLAFFLTFWLFGLSFETRDCRNAVKSKR